MKIVELFAGDRSIGKVAEKMGHEVFSVDWENYEGIDLVVDIEGMESGDVPFVPDVVWASFDCTTYSIAACSTHRNRDRSPKTEYAIKCDNVNQNVIAMVEYWLGINPDLIYFFENPRGNLRHMPWMKRFKRHTVWYCQYSDERAKPTDIWTNSETWVPRPMCHNYKYDSEGNIIDRHCHHESARRGARTGTQGRKGSFERSKIPEELCVEIIESFNYGAILIDIDREEPHSVCEVICVKCFHRYIYAYPSSVKLKDLECKNCGAGSIIKTGQEI